MTMPDDDDDWRYWSWSPPDATLWRAAEWTQGDENGPWDLPPYSAPTAELLAQEEAGWLTVGVWWRPIPW